MEPNVYRESLSLEPTETEFRDFLTYSKIIKSITEKHGICIVKPPKSWRPTFVIDLNKKILSFKKDKENRKFSIYEFGEKADNFKRNFFQIPVDKVNENEIETNFWKLHINGLMPPEVKKINELCLSGFPRRNCCELTAEDKKYVSNMWNFNNFNSGSLLSYLHNSNYAKTNQKSNLEMCFNHSFWSISEAFTFSISYIHWGDSKTWYCIQNPSDELTEMLCCKAINKKQVNDLIKSHEAIKAIQKAGCFVFIHPRAATFSLSHGYNWSEKISYLPQDWLQYGHLYWRLQCKRRIKSFPFTYEELLFKNLSCLTRLGSDVVEVLGVVVQYVVEWERKERMELRKVIPNLKEEKKEMELIDEKVRTCYKCFKVVFLTAVFCINCKRASCARCCFETGMCCGTNINVTSSNLTLYLRHSDEGLLEKLQKVKNKMEGQKEWMRKAQRMLSNDDDGDDRKMTLQELYKLREDALELMIDDVTLRDEVNTVVRLSEEIMKRVEDLFMDERSCKHKRPTLVEVSVLLRDMKTSKCRTNKLSAVEEVIQGIEDFIKEVGEILLQCPLSSSSSSSPYSPSALLHGNLSWQLQPPQPPKVMIMMSSMDLKKVKNLLMKSKKMLVDVGETNILEKYYERCDWIRNVQSAIDKFSTVTTLDNLQKLIGQGEVLQRDEDGPLLEATSEVLTFLEGQVKYFKDLDRNMKEGLETIPHLDMLALRELVDVSRKYPKISFNNLSSIKKVMQEALTWESYIDILLGNELNPFVHDVKSHLMKGSGIPVLLDRFNQLNEGIKLCEIWLANAEDIFLKNSSDDLLEILAPRTNILDVKSLKKGGKKKRMQMLLSLLSDDVNNIKDADNALQATEITELQEMMIVRKLNSDKKLSEESKYCFCKQIKDNNMLECRLCKDLYHESCLSTHNNNKENLPSTKMYATLQGMLLNQLEWRFICPSCCRSKRPNLDQMLALIGESHQLPFRLAEARFIERIIERTMIWQKKVDKLINTDRYKTAAKELGQLYREAKRNMGLLTPKEVHDRSIYDQVWQDYYRSQGKEMTPLFLPTQNIPNDLFVDIEILQAEGDLLESSTKETLVLEKVCIAYKMVLEKMECEEENLHKPKLVSKSVPPKESNIKDNKNIKTIKRKKRKADSDVDKPQKYAKQKSKTFPKPIETGSARIRFYPLLKTKSTSRPGDISDDDNDDAAVVAVGKCKLFENENMMTHHHDDDDDIDHAWIKEDDYDNKVRLQVGNDDDMEDCSAKLCLKPMGREVNWIQCDRCARWYHLKCIGLNVGDIEEEEDFECISCFKNHNYSQ